MRARRSNIFSVTLAVVILLVCLSAVSATADTAADTVASLPGIRITTSVDKADIYIGDLITYTIAIEYDSSCELIPPPLGVNLGAFDVRDYTPDKTTKLKDGRQRTESSFTLSTFTTGDYVIPPVAVGFILPDGSRHYLLSELVPIKVKSLLQNSDDSADIAGLKTQYEFKRDYRPYYLWGGAGLLVLSLALFFWWRRRRRGKEEPVDLRPPWEKAFERLANLQQSDLLQAGEFKNYYIQLTEICRQYMGRMYIINVLDMTTDEFLANISKRETPHGLADRLKIFLNHADLVKFAKLAPESGRPEQDFQIVHEAIEEVRSDFERREEEAKAAAESKQTIVAGAHHD